MKNSAYLFTFLFLLFQIHLNAQTWSELGNLGVATNNNIFAICSDTSGNIYTAGHLTDATDSTYVAKYSGGTWTELYSLHATALYYQVNCLSRDASGNIYAAGDFPDSSGNSYVAKYIGGSWVEVGGPNSLHANSTITCMFIDAIGNVYVAGGFTNGIVAGVGNCYVAKYDGSTWSELGGVNSLGANNWINTICSDPTGNIYVAGRFTDTVTREHYIAKYNGTSWSKLDGLADTGSFDDVLNICSDPAGNIYAGGYFKNSTGNRYVAKYDGSSWTELGGLNALAANNTVICVCSDMSGNIYAGGYFTNDSNSSYVARYNGSSWSELGGNNSLKANSAVGTLFIDNAGYLYAAGAFTGPSGGQYVAKIAADTSYRAPNGIAENQNLTSVRLFPDPTNNISTISLTNSVYNATISVFDATGRIVSERKNQTGLNFTIDLSMEPVGTYFIKVSDDCNTWIGKVVLIH